MNSRQHPDHARSQPAAPAVEGAAGAEPPAAATVEARERAAREALAGTRFSGVRWVAETGSTNRDLLAEAASGAAEGAVLVTDHQTAGRGTKGRSWFDPPGGSLLVSVLLRPSLGPGDAHLFTMGFGVAAVEACAAVAGVDVGLKWPNDLFAGPRKLAGILAESVITAGAVDAVVVGMGLNVNWPPEIPTDLGEMAVALNHLAGADVDRVALLVEVLRRFDGVVGAVATEAGRGELLARYRHRCVTLGREVRIEVSGGSVTGTAEDVTDQGHLVVAVGGELVTFTAGDVVHLR